MPTEARHGLRGMTTTALRRRHGAGFFVLPSMEMENDERARLLAEYDRAVKAYSDAVAKLRRRAGTVSITEYQALLRHVDIVRLKSEYARLEVDRHAGGS
jgi:hypothetical protein